MLIRASVKTKTAESGAVGGLLTAGLACAGLVIAALTAAAPVAADTAGAATHHVSNVVVGGAVAERASYSPAELASLPQTTVSTANGRTVTGVALEDLLNASGPKVPAVKNSQLRIVATVIGARRGRVAFALGELDPGFGNHPALLVAGRHHDSGLVVPGDRDRSRSVADVSQVRVSVARPQVPAVPAGSVRVLGGPRPVTLTPAELTALPQHERTVTFLAGPTSQTHTETGPTLAAVLHAAHVRRSASASVAAVGSDGYTAVVTLAESTVAGRPLLVSLVEDGVALAQPRLVVDGDLKGGRYVSDLVELSVAGLAHPGS